MMIVIDATEGLSGDMLLAAMIGMLEPYEQRGVVGRLGEAAEGQGLGLILAQVEEGGERGLGVSYIQPEPVHYGASYAECFERLDGINVVLGSDGAESKKILEAIFHAEAEAHGVEVHDVHLHELGRAQALLNIAGIGMLSSELLRTGAEGYLVTSITTGMGLVVVSHGAVRVPAPVSEILLRGLKQQMGDAPGERATPTGIAAVKVLAKGQVEAAPATYARKRVGFGTKRFAGRLGRTALVLEKEP